MNSNQNSNSISNDFNCEQMMKDCRDSLNSIISKMPLFIKIVVFSTIIFFIINLFTPYVAFYLADIPYFTIFHLHLWRLFTTPFITTGLFSIIFSLIFWYRDAFKQEEENGTIKYMLSFFMKSFFIQILYCLLMLFISLIIQNTIMLKLKITMGGVRNEGLWPILMCDLTLSCLINPEQDMKFFFFPCIIKAKFYPLILFLFFTVLSGFNIDFEILCGIGFGFLYHYKLRNKLEISNTFTLKVENSFLCRWMTNKKRFISISNSGSPDIPTNLENVTQINKIRSFAAFQGKGFTVGSSDGSINRENVDYAHLSTKNSEENSGETETTLEINNSETQT